MKRSLPLRSSGVDRRTSNRRANGARDRAFIHDLVGLLAAIRLSASALRTRDTLTAHDLADVNRIEDATGMMSELVANLKPPREKAKGLAPPPNGPMDLYVVCCELAQVRRQNDGRAIHCRAFGDPRGRWDPRGVTRALADLLDYTVMHVGKGSPMTIAVTGMARHVRVDVHGFGSLSPEEREACVRDLSEIGKALPGATVAATVSLHAGSVFTLRLPR